MQFNLRDGPPSTWDRYGVDGNRDGTTDIYDPADAIPSAANYLRTLLRHAGGNLGQAIFGYNHSHAYVNDVLARARGYAGTTDGELAGPVGHSTVMTGCTGGGIDTPVGPAKLRIAERVFLPRAFCILPSWALAGDTGPATVDARLHDDIVWILRRYHLRVAAAAKPATGRTATAPPSTSSPPTDQPSASGTPPPAASPTTSAGPLDVAAPVPAPPARSCRPSSSSATTATPATARRAPAPAPATRTVESVEVV